MQVDAHIAYSSLDEVPALAQRAERLGVDGLWFSETAHDPFLGAALAAEHTTRVTIGTSVAIAFARSPTLLAYLAWDLAAQSRGRFVLGLGTQIRAHIERRFGMPWDPPAAKLRDTIGAIHAVWKTWRSGAPLDYQGRFYHLSLMTPFFIPPPISVNIPIVTAGVNATMCQVAGAAADGFLVHPFHSRAYLIDVIRPAIHQGRAHAGRLGEPFSIGTTVFTVTGESDAPAHARAREATKRSIAFYASTPSYRGVLAHHGWADVGKRLTRLAASGAWDAMAHEITDEMLNTFAVVAPLADLGDRIRSRYTGLVDHLGLYTPFSSETAPQFEALITSIRP